MPERTGAVLVTRPEPGASATAAELSRRGFSPLLAPLFRIWRRQAPLPTADHPQALLASSANALPALAADHLKVPLYVVGDATAARARGMGFTTVVSASGDAVELARLVAQMCQPNRGSLLLAAGARQGNGLALALRSQGFAVIRRSVYRAEPVRSLPRVARLALAERRLGAALYFSAETAATFVRLISKAGLSAAVEPVAALAIGPAAANALRPLPFRCIRVAVRPTEEAVLAMLE